MNNVKLFWMGGENTTTKSVAQKSKNVKVLFFKKNLLQTVSPTKLFSIYI